MPLAPPVTTATRSRSSCIALTTFRPSGTLAGVANATLPRRTYSERLGELSGEQLQAALDRFDLGTLIDAAPARGGLFGQNVLLSSSRGEFVLRGCPHADWQLPKEQRVARMIHERTSLGAPWPYQIEESREIFGWSFALMPRIAGESDPPDTGESGRLYAAALGAGLARLHELQAPEPAYIDPGSLELIPYPAPHAQRVLQQARERIQACRDSPDMSEADVAWVEAILQTHQSALEEPFQACWVHHDWKAANVLAERTADGWHVNGVVDLMEGYFGDPEEDLVRCVARLALGDKERIQRFTGAYRARRPLRPGFAERYRIYAVIDALVIWDYGKRNLLWIPEGVGLRAFAQHFVEEIRPFA